MNTKFLFSALAVLSLGFSSCKNSDIEFDDYGTVACYFPVQRPVRTLILGDYELGLNENDNNHQFEIGATLAGLYENKTERKFHYEVDESLLKNVKNVVPLPKEYYTIETSSPVSIPKGSFKGKILVKLTDAFFDDPKAIAPYGEVNYVLPLKMTGVENVDTILRGNPVVTNPDPVNEAHWDKQPQDYILYGIKYINKYDASYLRRGVDRVKENNTEVVYRNQYIERDEVVPASSASFTSVTLSNMIRRKGEATPGNINLKLVFDDKENCIVYNADTDEKIGTGNFVNDSEYGVWGKKVHDVIFLDYTYFEPTCKETHHVSDTLVYRSRNVKYEEFNLEFNN